MSSCLFYYAENTIKPDKFSSIPQVMWWAGINLTTIGYGDIYPATPIGKFLTSVVSLLGVGLFAIPTGILSAAFVEEMLERREKLAICPHCGTKLSN